MDKKKTKKTKTAAEKRSETRRSKHAVEKIAQGEVGKRIYDILGLAERVEYNDAELYIIRSPFMEELERIVKMGERQMEAFEASPKDFDGRVVKIINRDKPAYSYAMYMRETPLIITDPDKCQERIAKEISVWAEIQKKGLEESFVNGEFTDTEKAKLRSELEEEIAHAKDMAKNILDNYDEYEVIITNYGEGRLYPAIRYTDKDGKNRASHLSIRVPNVLWFEDDTRSSLGRSNATVKQFIKEASKIGSTVYFKKRGQGED